MFGATGHGNNEEDEEDVAPPLLEEAVNLLLVNKTVMSCILVLQNRRDTEKYQESTTTELPTVIQVPLKVCKVLFFSLGVLRISSISEGGGVMVAQRLQQCLFIFYNLFLCLQVDREMQTDPEPIRSLRRRIRKGK